MLSMETCVLIPREFSLVLKPFASPPSPELTPRKRPGSLASAAGRERLEAGGDKEVRRSPTGNSWEDRRGLITDFLSKSQACLSPKNGQSIYSNGLKSDFPAKKDSIGGRRGSLETPSPEPSGEEGDIDVTGEGDRTPSPPRQPLRPIPVYRPLEMGATLWANIPLYPGQTFYADQGEIRLDHLEIYNLLPRFDVSTFPV